MKKIGILTFHRAYNYGAVLQCYALTQTLKSLGADVEVIDYYPQYFKDVYYFIPQKPTGYRSLKKALKLTYGRFRSRKVLKCRNNNFETFITKYLPLTPETYRNADQIDAANLEYDQFITGSDQVWSTVLTKFDRVFFLDFKGAQNKYSYAASFGFETIPDELKEDYFKRLSDYAGYSVREESGAKIISELLNQSAKVCCDPTLLLDASVWRKLLNNYISKHSDSENYILMYYVTKEDTLRKNVIELSKKKKCKVISMPCRVAYPWLLAEEERKSGFEVDNTGGPLEFVSLFANARYVVTNSFHGTVFSLLFHKQFKSQIMLDTGKRNGRSESLLRTVDLMDRYLENTDIDIDAYIGWDFVDRKLEEYRGFSLDYLKTIANPDLNDGQ